MAQWRRVGGETTVWSRQMPDGRTGRTDGWSNSQRRMLPLQRFSKIFVVAEPSVTCHRMRVVFTGLVLDSSSTFPCLPVPSLKHISSLVTSVLVLEFTGVPIIIVSYIQFLQQTRITIHAPKIMLVEIACKFNQLNQVQILGET